MLLVMPDAGEFPAVSVQVVPTIQVLLVSRLVLPVGVNVPVQVTASLATEIAPREPLSQAISPVAKAVTASDITIVRVGVSPTIMAVSAIVILLMLGAVPSYVQVYWVAAVLPLPTASVNPFTATSIVTAPSDPAVHVAV